MLLELLDYVHKNFPAVERIAAYGTAKDVLKKSEEDLKALAAAGLELIYLGAESGDDLWEPNPATTGCWSILKRM